MQYRTTKGSLITLLSLSGLIMLAPSCGDDEGDGDGKGKGGSSGSAGSGPTGGSAGTPPTGGSSGATTGGSAGTSGGSGGSGGASGSAGSAGAGGTAGGGTGGSGGNEGGMGGEGGMGDDIQVLYDFEDGEQGWATSAAGVTVAASTDQAFDGTMQSLKITHGALDSADFVVGANSPNVWPGTVLTFHAYLPAGWDTSGGTFVQAIGQGNNYATFDSAGNSTRTWAPGAWTTWTYTVPDMFPGGIQMLGFQVGDNADGATIAAGDIYIDEITATGGVENCAPRAGTGSHTFEAALDANVYQKDGTDADTTHVQSTDQYFMGAGSWKVSFAALPAPATGMQTSRRVFIASPNIYCGQTATFHVRLPAGSDGLTFQVFAQYNNYALFGASGPSAVTRDGWTTYAYAVPTNVGPGGIQRLGVQFIWSGTTDFTGDVYIDDITW